LKILFDHNVDRRFRRLLPGHLIQTTREMRWEQLQNGDLLKAASDASFEAFISIDKNLRYEQNLKKLPIAIIVLDSISNALPALTPFAPHVLQLAQAPLARMLYTIAPDGTVTRLP